jgi:KDO2-lipid IV(A) lauroyltransferase
MKQVVEFVVYVLVRGVVGLLSVLPHGVRVALFAALFRLAFLVIGRLRRTALCNLALAFPESSAQWRRDLLRANCVEMGRLLADMVRLPQLSPEWARAHVRCDALHDYVRLLQPGAPGVLIATGHLGSFELLGHAIGLFGFPLSAVARNFRSARLDRWWMGLREARGNTIISRKGAFQEIVKTLQTGRSVAVLFDQNVTANHAIFPRWFDKPAATTRALALAAVRTEAPLFVASMRYCGNDMYSIEALQCDCKDIYRDESISTDEKVAIITQRLSDHFCEMIRKFPQGWFWLHRRWKTRPPGELEDVYR